MKGGRNRKKGDKMKFPIKITTLLLILSVFICLASCGKKEMNDLPLLASCDFEDGQAKGWKPNIPENWRVAGIDDSMVYELVSPGIYGEIRAPTSWSILAEHDLTSFEIEGRLKCKAEASNPHRDMCIIFHFQDPTHFYYVHFSASTDSLHNIIGLVNGTDRFKINSEPPGESVFRLTDRNWHRFKVSYDAEAGDIKAFLDDMDTPILTARDKTLAHGFVGVGSFDDTGYFDNITLKGKKKAQNP
jgi:hypothetical protein